MFVYLGIYNFFYLFMKFGNMSTCSLWDHVIISLHQLGNVPRIMFLGKNMSCFIEEEPLGTRKLLTCMII